MSKIMIPILSITNSIAFIVAFVITLYLWRAYLKSREELLKRFLYFFISLSFLFLSISVPFLAFKTIPLITFAVIVMPFCLYLVLAFISSISLRILKWPKLEKLYLIVILIFLIFSYLMLFMGLKPVQIKYTNDFMYWTIPNPSIYWQIGSVTAGIISVITLFSVAIFFFVGGFKSREKFIRWRAFLLAGGLLLLNIAGAINFFFAVKPNFPAYIIASFVSILSFLILFAGIVIVKPQKNN